MEMTTVTTIARIASLALLTFTLAGIGCGQQDESHTNTAPLTNADPNAPTPATEPAPTVPAKGTKTESAPDPTPAAEKSSATAPKTDPAKSGAGNDGEVKLEKVGYDALLKRIAANPSKARYTVIDCWATWCGPCKENFSHVVLMSQKYGDKGLAVASLSFDDPAETKQVDEARQFLREKKANFTNYLLDEEFGVGFEKFGVNSIPAVFIYGPDGQEVKRFSWDDPNNQFTYDEVEKTVVALLEGK
jgi:thiol-disulfide isomerase/thioredoxin